MAEAADSPPGEVAVFVHQPSRSITLVEGSLDVESLLREVPWKEGTPPATKASIESLPLVPAPEAGDECAICLAEYEVNGGEEAVEVKEMPCRHRFHPDCIDRWLGIHGSCPICRFRMPAEEERKESEERGGWRIHVFLARGRRDPNPDSDAERNWESEDEDEDGGDDGNGDEDGGDDGNGEDEDESAAAAAAEDMDIDFS